LPVVPEVKNIAATSSGFASAIRLDTNPGCAAACAFPPLQQRVERRQPGAR
jgi:hypothetical protein